MRSFQSMSSPSIQRVSRISRGLQLKPKPGSRRPGALACALIGRGPRKTQRRPCTSSLCLRLCLRFAGDAARRVALRRPTRAQPYRGIPFGGAAQSTRPMRPRGCPPWLPAASQVLAKLQPARGWQRGFTKHKRAVNCGLLNAARVGGLREARGALSPLCLCSYLVRIRGSRSRTAISLPCVAALLAAWTCPLRAVFPRLCCPNTLRACLPRGGESASSLHKPIRCVIDAALAATCAQILAIPTRR